MARMSSAPPHSHARLRAEEAIDEALVDLTQREEQRANRATADRSSSRRARIVRVALTISLSILLILVVMSHAGWSLSSGLPLGSSAADREQAEDALRGVINEIREFQADYGELPQSLAEVGLPASGTWSFTKKADGRYRVTVMLRGRVATFEGS
jgi:hypothetical protein